MLSMATVLVATSMVVGQAEVKVPEKILGQMEFLVGEWEVEGEHGGKIFKGTYSAKWSPNKHCLILTLRDHRGISSGIGGLPEDVADIIRARATEMPELLREANGLTPDQLRKVREQIRRLKQGNCL